ncbi:MAG TPA: NfeD family protein [Thermohalobaculum sp.]|nr:NfeD family protein [Thermohalobaculum sp.]
MGIDLFAFLDGASPWWWIAFALALGAVEIVTFTYFMLWLALAALTVGLALMLAPDLSGTAQLLGFGLFALIYTGIGWAWVRRRQSSDAAPGLNRRAAALVGRQAVVAEPFAAGVGRVEVDGVRWRARLAERRESPPGEAAPPATGAVLTITAAEGATLIVTPSR